jgi:hypothetical protein
VASAEGSFFASQVLENFRAALRRPPAVGIRALGDVEVAKRRRDLRLRRARVAVRHLKKQRSTVGQVQRRSGIIGRIGGSIWLAGIVRSDHTPATLDEESDDSHDQISPHSEHAGTIAPWCHKEGAACAITVVVS